MMNNQVLPTLNIVYRGTCEYTGNYWNPYEMTQGWIFYDDNGEFYLRVKRGKKFPEYEGRIAIIGYSNWEDLLKDWYVPRIVQADAWCEASARKNFEGNTEFDEISGVDQSFHYVYANGWRGENKGAQLVWPK